MISQRGGTSTFLLLALAALALVLGVLGGRWWLGGMGPTEVPQEFPGTVLPQGRELPEFALTDGDGQPFGPARFQGKWSFLFFGYTHCPDVCPTTLSMLGRVRDGLMADGGIDDVQFVFVSVDPQRDSTAHLKEYVEYFDPAFVGVTGSNEELAAFTRSLGAIYIRVKGSSEENYLVDHTAAVFLIDPEGNFKALFSGPHQADKIVTGLNALRD